MSVRFVHAADLHLDSPFVGIGVSAPPSVLRTLRDATFATYDKIIDLCIDERVDALLVAGDIYDGADRSLRAQQKFVAGLDRLHEAGIRSFVCHGNHDHLAGWEAKLAMPASCHRFGKQIEAVPFDPANPTRGMVYGMSYPQQKVLENVARQFRRDQAEGIAIGLLHCNVGGNTGHEPYAPCTVDDLVEAGMDYWALGHVHTAQVLKAQSPAIVYPGNPQGRHPNETGARGVYLVSIDNLGNVDIEPRTMDVVRWAAIEVSILGLDVEQDLLDRIETAVAKAQDDADGRDLVYRLSLSGTGSLHGFLQRQATLDDIREGLNRMPGTPFAWCGRVESETRPVFDRERARDAGDFLSEVLTIVDAARGDPDLRTELTACIDALYGHAGARKYLKDRVPEGEDLDELIADAELRIAEYLAGDSAR